MASIQHPCVCSPFGPKTREDFLKYYCQLTLDLNTVQRNVCLSEENTKLTYCSTPHSYPDHPDRFTTNWFQVLCRDSLSSPSYWEVDWSGTVFIAVSSKGITRCGDNDSWFAGSDKAWTLVCSPTYTSFWHKNKETPIRMPCSSKVGVYLDQKAGTLSFYSVTNTMTLLHKLQTTFTEPLYPGFNLSGTIKILPLTK
ncbi:tripartite motif-containing protein 16 [Esox lucius]|uniref:tripartite motif-containing protein 16 n=1 Tax=Esox lucius TaxID=8010 RepID=UPI00147743E8|nr:tripartite motif-containing protein 16 [Esox lucius]